MHPSPSEIRIDQSFVPGGHVLVVDDDPEIRALIGHMVTPQGYRVREAADGVEALALIRECPPAVILLDLHLPLMDGWQFLDEYDRLPVPRARVILFSGIAGSLPPRVWHRVDGVLGKPVMVQTLIATLRHHWPAASPFTEGVTTFTPNLVAV
jgi:CheY-like chemotaxis protein